MAPNKNECICDVNDNNEFTCGKGCINYGKPCSSNKDCKKKKTVKKSKGGNKREPLKIKNLIGFKNQQVRSTALNIYWTYKKLPVEVTRSVKTGEIQKVKYTNIEGFDTLELYNKPVLKLHPIKAIVFVVAGKYIHVPDYLLGPLKYASETINIEQLFIDNTTNKHYQTTGEKKHALVTGSCASLTISAITLKFVEDMVSMYTTNNLPTNIYELFRNEYDNRVADYLCGKGIVPKIPWFKNRVERNNQRGPFTKKERTSVGCDKNIFEGKTIADNASTL